MNIFVLDKNPTLAAQYAVDTHAVKMVLESAQMLSTVHHLCHSQPHETLYRATHINHPCTKWCRETTGNYQWALAFFFAQAWEFTHRYNKTHLSYTKFSNIFTIVPDNIPDGKITPFAQAMPLHLQVPGDAVTAYRNYYNTEKRHLHVWTRREIPPFIT